MKKLSDILIREKETRRKPKLDEKSIFYFFERIVEKEYGSKGLANLKADFLKNGKLFIKAKSSAWANELWISRKEVVEKLNKEIGSQEIDEIKVKS
jgi:predicted nucleic acid-binding Zn ribbon protein